MLANRREKMIAMGLMAALGIWALNYYLLTPYTVELAQVRKDIATYEQKVDKANRLFKNDLRVKENWRSQLAGGLKTDPAEAESQALHAMRDYAQISRVDMQSLKPERTARVGDFQQVRIQATGNGSTAAIATLVSQIETARIPLRVNELRLTARKEGTDDLSFALNVSTIVFTPAPETKVINTRAAAKGDVQ